MGRVAAIGAGSGVTGFALAGVVVAEAADPAAVHAAWDALPADVDLVVLTPLAADVLRDRTPPGHGRPLTVVLPP